MYRDRLRHTERDIHIYRDGDIQGERERETYSEIEIYKEKDMQRERERKEWQTDGEC
jgi:hypothetical protein